MPARKTTVKQSPNQSSSEISFETRMIIIIVLLLFVYPVGLILMWFWMREWPIWLKVILSLPILAGILAMIVGLSLAAFLIRHVVTSPNFQPSMREYMRNRYYYQQMMTPAPTSSDITITPIPTTTSNAY